MDWHKPQHQIHPPPPPALTSSHPSFSVTEDRTLDLREAGSQIVIQTIEDALRQGGLALLGEGFQLDSSLSYHSGDNEGIEGDLDVVVPLWNGGRHAIFTQPGFVFWKGLEGEERFDGNIGLVYRAELTRNLIAGASVFYDHDFQIGHSRVSGGLDLQSGFFRFGANYYHPLNEIEDGREGFVEEALSGMDARLVFEREAVRLGSTVGYWDYKGEESGGQEDNRSGWKTSIGLDFGVRILPGVFAEASWERHKDNIVLDERIFAGLAFRFSLPGFQGASYGSGEMTSNLYKIVDREKRILYEERVGLPSVSLSADSTSVAEGDTATITLTLGKALGSDATFNLIGSGGAEYGTDNDWNLSIGGTDCDMASESNPCQVTITQGDTTAEVTVEVSEDSAFEPGEDFTVSVAVDPGSANLVLTGSSSNVSFRIPSNLPTVSLNYTGSTSVPRLAAGSTAIHMRIDLSNELTETSYIDIVSDGTAVYDVNRGWFAEYLVVPAGQTPGTGELNPTQSTTCETATRSSCRVEVPAGVTTVRVQLTIGANANETVIVSVEIPSISENLLMPGSTTRHELTTQ